jgi:hypothetical protein
VLLAVLAVILVAIAVSCGAGSGGGHPSATATSPKPKPSGSSSSPSVAPGACVRSQLAVTATTDADTYAAGTLPRLQLVIRNTGSVACVLSESPSTRSWTIVSGPDKVWTTAGCATSHRVSQTTLSAGGSARHSLVWNRHRSGQKCATSTVEAAPGTYQLTVVVNGVTSGPAVFHLTG